MPIEYYISFLGDWISYAGILVVLMGVIITIGKLIRFFFLGLNEERSLNLRHSLMMYLSLGLDFSIAKDVIITLSLERTDYDALIQLVVIIIIRVLLSVFVHLEEGSLHSGRKRKKKKA
jgi:uncharacterized membrane protein